MQNENKAYPMSRLLEALQLEQTLEQHYFGAIAILPQQ